MLRITKTRLPRSIATVVALVLTAFSLPVLGAISANASTPGGFEIDGNTVVNTSGNQDWANVLSAPSGDDNAPENTVFSASAKEDDPPSSWTAAGAPPPKG